MSYFLNLITHHRARFLLLCTVNLIIVIRCEPLVTGRCGRPGLPPKSHLYQVSPERSRFDHNERVFVICEENQFPPIKQMKTCKNGQWSEKMARCGKSLDAQVVSFTVRDCYSKKQLLFAQNITQTAESDYDLFPNAFHSSRVDEETIISVNGSDCYEWQLKLNRRVQIAFLLIDIFTPIVNTSTVTPHLEPNVSSFRNCGRKKLAKQVMGSDEIIGYYFFCDLKSDEDHKRELTLVSDSISFRINATIRREIGLEAVFLGGIYTIGSLATNKQAKPDCGTLEIQTPGVNMKKEQNYYTVRCNDSFYDYWLRPNVKSKFICDHNGQWIGEWPSCIPIVTCPKDLITIDDSVSLIIEEIGNVYYANSSDWYAINQTWIRYGCPNVNDILIGKNTRVCQYDGKWSNQTPYCSSHMGLSSIAITIILLAVLIVFGIIVFIVFRIHTKRVKKDLNQTRKKLEDSMRKRESQECYAEIRDSLYADNNCGDKSTYETVDYGDSDTHPRYDTGPPVRAQSTERVYLDMLAVNDNHISNF